MCLCIRAYSSFKRIDLIKVHFNLITEPALGVVGCLFYFCFLFHSFLHLHFYHPVCFLPNVLNLMHSSLIFSFCIIYQRFLRIYISFYVLFLLHPQGLISSIFMIIYF